MGSIRIDTICLRPDQTLADAIACIDASGGQIALVVDESRGLLGTITDGDVRRGILRGVTLGSLAREVMNPSPRMARRGTSPLEIAAILRREQIAQIPLVDESGRVVDIVVAEDLTGPDPASHPVVIMAGGLGTRLRPITETIPKPMIEIGGKPILEGIIERFRQQGFVSMTLCVNHLAQIIEDYFEDGSRFGVSISYVHEAKRMGTAGALSLLSPRPTLPMIVINGDILTTVNFARLLAFHYEHEAHVTMGLNRFQYQIPYGVVDVNNHHIVGFKEKPVLDFFVNAGIYVVGPEAMELIPEDRFFDMPSLFDLIAQDRRAAFPIHEYWIDIGRQDDLERATREYGVHLADNE